jgi:hypothetical protein
MVIPWYINCQATTVIRNPRHRKRATIVLIEGSRLKSDYMEGPSRIKVHSEQATNLIPRDYILIRIAKTHLYHILGSVPELGSICVGHRTESGKLKPTSCRSVSLGKFLLLY